MSLSLVNHARATTPIEKAAEFASAALSLSRGR
jgi:hypothetical protein